MRLGINVPNELLARIEPVKNSINISQICRRALEEYATTYERAQNRVAEEGMHEAARRFWLDEERLIVDWEDLGYEDAHVWAGLATYQDIHDLFHNLGVSRRINNMDFIPFSRHIPDTKQFVDRQAENQEWFYHQIEIDESRDCFGEARTEYERAWIAYLTAIWERVKQFREEHAEAIVVKRQSRPQPEPPEQLLG